MGRRRKRETAVFNSDIRGQRCSKLKRYSSPPLVRSDATQTPHGGIPKIDLSSPEIPTDLPKIDLSSPQIPIDLPKIDLSSPEIPTDLPKIDLSSPQIPTDLPKIDLSSPQIPTDLPKIDLSSRPRTPRLTKSIDISSTKGLVKGPLKFKDGNGDIIDCSTTAKMIPLDADSVKDISSDARFILLVEKICVGKLLARIQGCIVVTSRGLPDPNAKLFLKRLNSELKLHVFAFLDCHPRSLFILSDLKNLFQPDIIWLGIRPSQVPRELNFKKKKVPGELVLLENYRRRELSKHAAKMLEGQFGKDIIRKSCDDIVNELHMMAKSKVQLLITSLHPFY